MVRYYKCAELVWFYVVAVSVFLALRKYIAFDHLLSQKSLCVARKLKRLESTT